MSVRPLPTWDQPQRARLYVLVFLPPAEVDVVVRHGLRHPGRFTRVEWSERLVPFRLIRFHLDSFHTPGVTTYLPTASSGSRKPHTPLGEEARVAWPHRRSLPSSRCPP